MGRGYVKLILADIFCDGMVLQQNKTINLWGEAPEGIMVTINFAGITKRVVSKKGQWRIQLPAMSAGGPYILQLQAEDEKKYIQDIWIGEVWIAGGQSNMEWPLKWSVGWKEAIDTANYENIRFFSVPKLLYEEEKYITPEKFTHQPTWKKATKEHVGEFSAVAYYFAKDIHERFGIPIGIIECNLGGSSAAAWTSISYLKKDPTISVYLKEYENTLKKIEVDIYNQQHAVASRKLLSWSIEELILPDQELEDINGLSLPEDLKILYRPGPRKMDGNPGRFFKTMLSTIVPYTCQGVLFYQGEADDLKARIYAKLFKGMIESWRDAFEDNQLYFLYVQLAAYGREGHFDGDSYAILRQQQKQVLEMVPYTGMAVAMDMGHKYDIHPRRKSIIGQRLSLVAREKVYGESIDSCGPEFESMTVEEERLILKFSHTGKGLFYKGQSLSGFRICGNNRRYYEANAEIDGDTVILTSPHVKEPEAATYGWANYCEVNMYNKEGLPAIPFKTDQYL